MDIGKKVNLNKNLSANRHIRLGKKNGTTKKKVKGHKKSGV